MGSSLKGGKLTPPLENTIVPRKHDGKARFVPSSQIRPRNHTSAAQPHVRDNYDATRLNQATYFSKGVTDVLFEVSDLISLSSCRPKSLANGRSTSKDFQQDGSLSGKPRLLCLSHYFK